MSNSARSTCWAGGGASGPQTWVKGKGSGGCECCDGGGGGAAPLSLALLVASIQIAWLSRWVVIESIRLLGVSEFAGACNHTKNPKPQWNKNERYDDKRQATATDLCGSLSARLRRQSASQSSPETRPRTGGAEVMALV